MAIHFKLGPYYFNSKKAAKRAIRQILQLPEGFELVGPELEIVQDLFKHSPKRQLIESRGGVKEFIIDDISSQGKTNKRFMVICGNGNRIDFSASDCLDNYKDKTQSTQRRRIKRATSFLDLVDDACRTAVEDDIREYREKNLAYLHGHGVNICPLSGWILDWSNAEVDHDDPYPFVTIADMFIKSLGYDVKTLNELQPEELKTENKNARVRFVADNTTKTFRIFHRKYAKFRLITKEENNKRIVAQKAKRKQGSFELV